MLFQVDINNVKGTDIYPYNIINDIPHGKIQVSSKGNGTSTTTRLKQSMGSKLLEGVLRYVSSLEISVFLSTSSGEVHWVILFINQ